MKSLATIRNFRAAISFGIRIICSVRMVIGLALCSDLVSQASASTIFLHLGPPSAGGGGTNPLSIPPGVLDTEFVYLTQAKREITVGLIPGILYGARFGEPKGAYVSMGGGLIFNPDVATIGAYSAFGYSGQCNSWCFNIEYKQSVGLYAGRIVTPYAVRAGVGYQF
jgi:hypothetical protein